MASPAILRIGLEDICGGFATGAGGGLATEETVSFAIGRILVG